MPLLRILVAVVVILGAAYFFAVKNEVEPPRDVEFRKVSDARSTLRAPKGLIKTIVADTPALRSQGLSGRQSLGGDEGMIFIFEQAGRYGFWMQDMNFPLDIIWIDEQKKVIGVTKDISPATYPSTFFPPSEIKYALELNSGKAGQFGIATGTVLEF